MAQGYAFLARRIPANRLAPNTVIDSFDGVPSLNFSNRYFTPRRNAPATASLDFSREIDPAHILTSMIGETYIHAEENVVKFYQRKQDQDGDFRCETPHS
jgi:hypothetical protein